MDEDCLFTLQLHSEKYQVAGGVPYLRHDRSHGHASRPCD